MESPFVLLGTIIGSAFAAFFAGRKTTPHKRTRTLAEIVEELYNRHHRHNVIFLRAHIESWELPRVLKELVAAEFEEAEREGIFRSQTLREGLGNE